MNDNVKCLIDNVVDTALGSKNIREISIYVNLYADLFEVVGEIMSRFRENHQHIFPYYSEDEEKDLDLIFEDGVFQFKVLLNLFEKAPWVAYRTTKNNRKEEEIHVTVCIPSSSYSNIYIEPSNDLFETNSMVLDLR